MNAPLLSVRDLDIAFRLTQGERRVVQGATFDVHAGETLALVGGSGSGKSVTALSLLQLLDHRISRVRGVAQFAGHNLLTLPPHAVRQVRGNQIGMIFQEPMTSLNPVLTIGAQLTETLRRHRGLSHREALRQARQLLDKVRIPAAQKRLEDYPHRFSGGMRQRVMIAMAMACRPQLLIADEPTTALDVTVQAQILDLMRALQQEDGVAILFITHDMAVVAEMAQRLLVMHDGCCVEAGQTDAIFRAATHPYTRSLLTAVPRLGSMQGTRLPRKFASVDPATGKPDAGVPDVSDGDIDTVQHDAPPVLSVQGLTTRFDVRSGLFQRVTARVHAVQRVDFTLRRGETLALVGESGCGKSTLARSLMRLERMTAGEVTIDGAPLHAASRKTRIAQMQMVFQDPYASLNPRLRVGDSIAAPLLHHGGMTHAQAQARAQALLDMVGLQAHMHTRYPHEFSGGQRQRICMARALALEPKIVVADEAVSALDASVKTQLLNLMLDLQARLGLSYLFISHDMAVVERIAHRVAVMYLGEIVEIGPRAAIFEHPHHPYTRRLMAAVPVPDPTRRRVRPSPPAHEVKSPIFPLDYRPPVRRYREIGAAHVVQVWDAHDWAATSLA